MRETGVVACDQSGRMWAGSMRPKFWGNPQKRFRVNEGVIGEIMKKNQLCFSNRRANLWGLANS